MLLYIFISYCVIGFIVGINHLSSGKVGAKGPLITLAASVLLWPIFLANK
jgi:hypothetical protein